MIKIEYAALLILLSWFAAAAITAHGQEKPARPTRQWQAATISYNDWTSARIDVIDMEGVCLYTVARSGDNVSIAAIPKTQLPVGTGCQ